jgi:hypothetical protein
MSESQDPYARVYRRVDEILHYVWDPIGVAGAAGARDEYDGYVPQVVAMLFEGCTADAIASHLSTIETESMGLSRSADRDASTRRVSKVLIDHYRWLTR